MNFHDLLDSITPAVYENLKRAVEIGKWPDGRALTAEQRELSLQTVIAYEQKHIPEHERTGYIDLGSKAEGAVCDDDHAHDDDSHGRQPDAEQPLKWQ